MICGKGGILACPKLRRVIISSPAADFYIRLLSVRLVRLNKDALTAVPADIEAQGRAQVTELEIVVAAAGVVQQCDGCHLHGASVDLNRLDAACIGPVPGVGGGHFAAASLIGLAGEDGDGFTGIVVAYRELRLGAVEDVGHVTQFNVIGAVALLIQQGVHLELHRLAVHGDRLGAGLGGAAGGDGVGGRGGLRRLSRTANNFERNIIFLAVGLCVTACFAIDS